MVVQGLPAKGLRAVLSEDGLFVFVSAVMFVVVLAVSMFMLVSASMFVLVLAVSMSMLVSAVSPSSKRLCIREAAGHLVGAGRIDIDSLPYRHRLTAMTWNRQDRSGPAATLLPLPPYTRCHGMCQAA